MKRKYFIDNLRWLAILLLFPFHAAQVWSGGEYSGFYIWSHTDTALYVFSNAVYPWYMTLLFTISGISCRYALQKRTNRQFAAERTKKLLIPFLFGLVVLVPVMTYVAEVFFNGYTGTYWQQYVLFFTKVTDLTGYRGGFTPAHLWFLIYLYLISFAALLIIRLQKKYFRLCGCNPMVCQHAIYGNADGRWISNPLPNEQNADAKQTWERVSAGFANVGVRLDAPQSVQPHRWKYFPKFGGGRLSYYTILLLFVPEWLSLYVLNIGGKSLGQFLLLFLFGYYIFSEESILLTVKKYRFVSLALALLSGGFYTYLYCIANVRSSWITGLYIFFGWMGIITLLGIGQTRLDFHNRASDYLARASFPVYILHMPVLVVVGFFVLKLPVGVAGQFLLIAALSSLATFLLYEIVKRVPVLRFCLGIAAPKA